MDVKDLRKACGSGSIKEVQRLVEVEKLSIYAGNCRQKFFLCSSSQQTFYSTFFVIIQQTFLLYQLWTPLICAAVSKDVQMIEFLLENGVDAELKDDICNQFIMILILFNCLSHWLNLTLNPFFDCISEVKLLLIMPKAMANSLYMTC